MGVGCLLLTYSQPPAVPCCDYETDALSRQFLSYEVIYYVTSDRASALSLASALAFIRNSLGVGVNFRLLGGGIDLCGGGCADFAASTLSS